MAHLPVLLTETIAGLALQPGQTVVDATVNRGGHSVAIGAVLGRSGHLIGLDADAEAISAARENLRDLPCRLNLVTSNFRQLEEVLARLGVAVVDACLFDLGLSSDQLDVSGRGFSFSHGAQPLTMTFAATPSPGALTAEEILNHWREESLADVIFGYGEEHFARRIAKAIVKAREQAPLQSTSDLVEVIRGAVPVWYTHRRLHFATKTFQALRIAVNDELGSLKLGLAAAWKHLRSGGRLAVISFHSLEARIVKNQFQLWNDEGTGHLITKNVTKPSRAEVLANPRSRSAQLRIIQKI